MDGTVAVMRLALRAFYYAFGAWACTLALILVAAQVLLR